MASLRPVATRSATSRQASTVSDDYSRTVLIKVGPVSAQHLHLQCTVYHYTPVDVVCIIRKIRTYTDVLGKYY